MHLLKTDCFELVEVNSEQAPQYAILSHTWGSDEVIYKDLQNDAKAYHAKDGWKKIEATCRQARLDGLDYAWIDTCCIDKSSSAELSEAINSMYRWYQSAERCYVYLEDIELADSNYLLDLWSDKPGTATGIELRSSRWFTRGWTLQELLAPATVQFYDKAWKALGSKTEHAMSLSYITGIDASILRGESSIYDVCVATRMFWASSRRTTRTEDLAYCLLGIFNVNLPMIYGEGKKSFTRLQEEIIKNSDDQSIFAWTGHPVDPQSSATKTPSSSAPIETGLLASGPHQFLNCKDYTVFRDLRHASHPFTLTNTGLCIEMPLLTLRQQLLTDLECRDDAGVPIRLAFRCISKTAGQYVRILNAHGVPTNKEVKTITEDTYGLTKAYVRHEPLKLGSEDISFKNHFIVQRDAMLGYTVIASIRDTGNGFSYGSTKLWTEVWSGGYDRVFSMGQLSSTACILVRHDDSDSKYLIYIEHASSTGGLVFGIKPCAKYDAEKGVWRKVVRKAAIPRTTDGLWTGDSLYGKVDVPPEDITIPENWLSSESVTSCKLEQQLEQVRLDCGRLDSRPDTRHFQDHTFTVSFEQLVPQDEREAPMYLKIADKGSAQSRRPGWKDPLKHRLAHHGTKHSTDLTEPSISRTGWAELDTALVDGR